LISKRFKTSNEILKPENIKTFKKKTETWDQEIDDLEQFFKAITLPEYAVKLKSCGTKLDVSLFIESHFQTHRGNNGNKIFLSHLNRLRELYQVITNLQI